MFEQHYDDIPRYTKQVYGDKFPQIEMHIPIRKMLMPLQKNIIEMDTSNTTHSDGESIFYIEVISILKLLKLIRMLK